MTNVYVKKIKNKRFYREREKNWIEDIQNNESKSIQLNHGTNIIARICRLILFVSDRVFHWQNCRDWRNLTTHTHQSEIIRKKMEHVECKWLKSILNLKWNQIVCSWICCCLLFLLLFYLANKSAFVLSLFKH